MSRSYTRCERKRREAAEEVKRLSNSPDELEKEPLREVDYGTAEERADLLCGDWVVSGMADGLHDELRRRGRHIDELQPKIWPRESLPVDEFPGLFTRHTSLFDRQPAFYGWTFPAVFP